MSRTWRIVEQVLAVWIVVMLVTWPISHGLVDLYNELNSTSIVDSVTGERSYDYSSAVRTASFYGAVLCLILSPLYLYVLARVALWMHGKIRPRSAG